MNAVDEVLSSQIPEALYWAVRYKSGGRRLSKYFVQRDDAIRWMVTNHPGEYERWGEGKVTLRRTDRSCAGYIGGRDWRSTGLKFGKTGKKQSKYLTKGRHEVICKALEIPMTTSWETIISTLKSPNILVKELKLAQLKGQ